MKGVQILSIDGKDLYATEKMGCEYSAKYADGRPNFKKYINSLDYSLDQIKMREIYRRVYQRNDFGFYNKDIKPGRSRREYTNQVVNLTFQYSYKEYNKANRNIYVRDGYSIRGLELEDSVCIVDGILIAIEVDKSVAHNRLGEVEQRYFKYDEETGAYRKDRNIKIIANVRQIREYLYKNGFTLDGIRYVRYKRSSGSARVGKCLFINETLFSRMHRWDMCGLRIKDGQNIDLAAFEAAVSLSLSSIIDTVEILPENILLIDDYDSVFEDDVIGVSLEGSGLVSRPQKGKISNSIWDGQSLLDKSVFGEKYADKAFLLLRQRFFKSACFSTNLQEWFADNNITDISQLNGVTMATDISQIKMITTPNSVKYLKFGTKERWLRNIDRNFGVVKYDKPTHYFDGRMVQTHYQLLNTLQLSYEDVEAFLRPSLDYITKIRIDPAVLRYHIRYPHCNPSDLEYRSKSDVVFGLMGLNEDFVRTKYYQDFKKDLIKSLVKNLRKGHVLVKGTYATMFGNGLEMLKSAIGTFDGETEIGVGNIYCKMFADGEEILGARSPHINSGNVYLATNRHLPEFDKYFNLTNEIMCVNTISENLSQRTNGSDFDSDTQLVTNNKLLIERAKQNYDKFLVPTSFVEADKIQRKYTTEHQADLDVRTSVNKIGEVINLSQELNSLMWHRINQKKNPQTIDDNIELYYDICKLAVLSGIEIDKAKKEFPVDSPVEIELLKNKYKLTDSKGMTVKPKFFKMITTDNGYPLNPNNKYMYRETPMDYLQKVIGKWFYSGYKIQQTKIIPMYSIIQTIGVNSVGGTEYKLRDAIISELRRHSAEMTGLFLRWEYPEDRKFKILALRAMHEEIMASMKITKGAAFLLLKTLDDEGFKDIKNAIFKLLFCYKNKALFEVFNDNYSGIDELREYNQGTISLYNFQFRRVPRCQKS